MVITKLQDSDLIKENEIAKYQDSIQDSGMVITKFQDSEPMKEKENAKIMMNIVYNGQNLVIVIIKFMALI